MVATGTTDYDAVVTDLADDLLTYIDRSPTAFHAVEETKRRLLAHDFVELDPRKGEDVSGGDRCFIVRGGTIIAFVVGTQDPTEHGVRMIGAHTDSPNLRVKPVALTRAGGAFRIGMETYGGVLQHTWLDRDLTLAGRVVIRADKGLETRLVNFARPLMRIPSLAIHLNRGVNKDGLKLNAQKHLAPMLSLETGGELDFRDVVADELEDVLSAQIVSWDLAAADAVPSVRSGLSREIIHAPRLDNLGSSHSAVKALLGALDPQPATRLIALYDHEECGSRSAQGAQSSFLQGVIERIVNSFSTNATSFYTCMANSFLVSADMAHAVHPNHVDRHEPKHRPVLGAGPVIKQNINQSYATNDETSARFSEWCRAADVVPQHFVTRTDLPCGTTIGPITAARLGVRAVDVGNPMLSMHSCRELCAAADVDKMVGAMRAFLTDPTHF